jgi:hypothetical protein
LSKSNAISALVAIAFLAIVASPQSIRAQDDWKVIERHTTSAPETEAAPAAKAGAIVQPCGEDARPAQEPYKSIVAQLNDMWGTNFPVFESVRAMSPHAHNGGCIFYNQEFLNNLMVKWMRIDDQDAVRPMLYAIFAHELGHLAHGDFDPGQDNVPVKNKELAADQFAGYSLARLGIRRLDSDEVTRYYQMTGDDFVGHSSGHGNGDERTSAFQDGWHRAEVGLPEQGSRPAGGLGEP